MDLLYNHPILAAYITRRHVEHLASLEADDEDRRTAGATTRERRVSGVRRVSATLLIAVGERLAGIPRVAPTTQG